MLLNHTQMTHTEFSPEIIDIKKRLSFSILSLEQKRLYKKLSGLNNSKNFNSFITKIDFDQFRLLLNLPCRIL
jgi:hypothetical protein